MATTPIATLKQWFKKYAKPTAVQFAAVFDSYRHKDEKITASEIHDLDDLLIQKADKIPFEAHRDDNIKHITALERTAWNMKLGAEDLPENILQYNPAGDAAKVFNEKGEAIPVPVLTVNTYYIDKYEGGNDSTGQKGSIINKYATLEKVFQVIQAEFEALPSDNAKRSYPLSTIIITERGETLQTITNDTQAPYRVLSNSSVHIKFAPIAAMYSYPFHGHNSTKDYIVPYGKLSWNKTFSGTGANWLYVTSEFVFKEVELTHNQAGTQYFFDRVIFKKVNVGKFKIKGKMVNRTYFNDKDAGEIIYNIREITFTGNDSDLFGEIRTNSNTVKRPVTINVGYVFGDSNVTSKHTTSICTAGVGSMVQINVGNVKNCSIITKTFQGGIAAVNFKDSIFESAYLTGNYIYDDNKVLVTGNIRELKVNESDVRFTNSSSAIYFKDFSIDKFTWNNPNTIDGSTLTFILGHSQLGAPIFMQNVSIVNCPFKICQFSDSSENRVVNSVLTTVGGFYGFFMYTNKTSAIDVYGNLETNFDVTTNANIVFTKKTTNTF